MQSADLQSLRDKARVLDELGEKVLWALGKAVDEARQDLARYRRTSPDIAAQSSARGLANWIHDRVWHHICRLLDDVEDVVLHEKGVIRELVVRDRYRLRVKRHHPPARVSTYPTQGALDFMAQPDGQLVLTGLELLRLVAGYQWDADRGEMGPAVLSMRHGIDSVLWVHELPSGEAEWLSRLPRRMSPAATVVRSRLAGVNEGRRRSADG